jgi:hypothetical protein
MKKQLSVLISAFFMLNCVNLFSQGYTCDTASQVCLNNMSSYPAGTGTGTLGSNIGCLFTTPNPAWVCFQVQQPGRINIAITSSPAQDLDFACWGPFSADNLSELHSSNACDSLMTDSTGCVSHPSTVGANPVDLGGYPIGNLIDCSYSTGSIEYVHIPNAQTGEWYLLLLTNFSNQPTNISFVCDPSSIGSSDCAFSAGVTDYSAPKVTVSPNPTSDVLNCNFENKNNRKLSIVDVAGKTIASWESNLPNEIIDIKAYANGVYFLKVEENGNQYSSKFVIRKD